VAGRACPAVRAKRGEVAESGDGVEGFDQPSQFARLSVRRRAQVVVELLGEALCRTPALLDLADFEEPPIADPGHSGFDDAQVLGPWLPD
jgi:hypothetical protein